MSEFAYIVPNPFREIGQWISGKEWKTGKPSPKHDDNVQYRRWLCLEWDMSKFGRDGKLRHFGNL
jgi:hypothetical protein